MPDSPTTSPSATAAIVAPANGSGAVKHTNESPRYRPTEIESPWQQRWEADESHPADRAAPQGS